MSNKKEENKQTEQSKINQHLSQRQKLLFTLFCWGIHSWGQAKNFKTNGYIRKHQEARQAIRIGLAIYSMVIVTFILLLLYINHV